MPTAQRDSDTAGRRLGIEAVGVPCEGCRRLLSSSQHHDVIVILQMRARAHDQCTQDSTSAADAELTPADRRQEAASSCAACVLPAPQDGFYAAWAHHIDRRQDGVSCRAARAAPRGLEQLRPALHRARGTPCASQSTAAAERFPSAQTRYRHSCTASRHDAVRVATPARTSRLSRMSLKFEKSGW